MAATGDFPIPPFPNPREFARPPQGDNQPHRPTPGQIGTTADRGAQRPNRRRSAAPAEPVGGDAVPEPSPGKITADPIERMTAKELLTSIGAKFAENRQKSKSKAFEIYQRDLATNSGALVMGGAVTLKELTVLLMDLESFMKSTV